MAQPDIVSIDQIAKTDGDVLLIDARSGLDAFAKFSVAHLEGAVFADLDKDLAEKNSNPSVGGRHPLPRPEAFAKFLGSLGITPATKIFIYDDKGGANAAARLWWMLKAAGHKDASVIDGGIQAAIASGFPQTEKMPVRTAVERYPFDNWQLPIATIEEVAEAARDDESLVIDVRESKRYNGETEPIDLIAGHIPGAINIPFAENLDPQQMFLGKEEMRKKYQAIIGERKSTDVIVHCGSGVTACHTLLALEHAGIKGAKLYVGSWSEWSRTGRPIGKEDAG